MAASRLSGLQALRGLAACMVLVGHVLAEAEHYFALSLPGDIIPWTRGVDIFFVISGFVVTLSATRFYGQPGAFFTRRLLRVVPLYFLFTTLMVAVLVLVPGATKDTALDPMQILSSYGFFPYERGDGRIAPVLSLGWTLNYEIFFYALFALCLALPRPILAITVTLLSLVGLGMLMDYQSPQITFWTNPLILEFVFGVALACLWQRGWHWPNALLAFALLLAGLVLLIAFNSLPLPRFVAAGLPATMIVAAGTLFCPLRPIPGIALGDASYALYLSHRFVLRAATFLVLPFLPASALGAWIYVVLVTGLALAVGVLTHLWVEQPMMRASRQKPLGVPA